jgi:hypothetical protein
MVGDCDGLGLVRSSGFLADGAGFFFARGPSVEFWRVDPPERLREVRIDDHASIDAAALSRDGRLVATSVGLAIQLWSAADGARLGAPMTSLEPVASLHFDPTGAHLLARTRNEVRIWRVADGREAAPPLRMRSLRRAEFSPDGSLLLTTARGQTRLWDWRTGRAVTDEFPSVFEATFSADGRSVVRGRNSIVELAAVPPAEAPPTWLGPLTESVFHEHLRDDGVIQVVAPDAWLQLRDRLLAATGSDFGARFGRWFATDPWRRTVTPETKDVTEDFLKHKCRRSKRSCRSRKRNGRRVRC